ncbi:MAG: dehydrogenase [Actinomycetia bacterium]|jgi:hypothetical protein|nr:dehydrogenase [Actinomycetes bacterium]MDQ1656556.1 hypothetical protein [Cryptosporangiaceae bacterium]
MRFMIIRKADQDTEDGALPTSELISAMGEYMEDMAKAGVLLGGDGLRPSALGARVRLDGGSATVIDGPFTESKELVAGYSLIQAKSIQEAIEWVKRWPALDGGGNVRIEIRQVFEAEDFGDAYTSELQARDERLRAR